MKRWSKLQKQIYNLMLPELDLQIHCAAYPMRSQRGSTDLGRYWITLGKDIIWNYPKDFAGAKGKYPYMTDISTISELVREYIDTPVESLLQKSFDKDQYGFTDILKAADRRLGTEKLLFTLQDVESAALSKVLVHRSVTAYAHLQKS